MSADAVNGNIHKNPYNFQHFNHSSVIISSDAHNQIQPIKSNFPKKLFLQAYLSLFESSGIFFGDTGNALTREEYAEGFSLIGFDLTSDLSSSENHWSLARQGSLRVDIQFSKALKEPICVIVFGEFDSLIEIDKNRNVSLDYSS